MRIYLWGVFIFFLFIFSYTIFSGIKTSITTLPDFSIFYNSARDVIQNVLPYEDKTLYTAFNYPLITTLFFIPLTFLPRVTAQIIFTFLSLISAFLTTYFSLKLNKQKVNASFFLVVSLIFLSFPTKFTLGMGQTNLIAYAFLLLGFFLYQQKKRFFCFFLLLLAIILKPVLGFTFIVFLFEKDWRYFFSVLLSCFLAIFIFPFVISQSSANQLFLHNLFSQTLLGREVYYNQGLLGFVSRITLDLHARFVLNLIGTLLLAIFIFLKIRRVTFIQKLSLLLTFLVIIDPLSWQHHFVFLILPFITTYIAIQKGFSWKPALALLVSYVLVSANIKNPQLFIQFPLSLLLSHQLYGTILLLILEIVFFKNPHGKKQSLLQKQPLHEVIFSFLVTK